MQSAPASPIRGTCICKPRHDGKGQFRAALTVGKPRQSDPEDEPANRLQRPVAVLERPTRASG
jgi:hypothetical protein